MCLVCVGAIALLSVIGWTAYAAGLVDEPTDGNYLYSMFTLSHYQLDFYVDNSWGWLPWNWGESIGKGVMYGIYAITNFLWVLSVYLSSATGALVQEAFNLDFVGELSGAIGANIQRLAGVSMSGISTDGLFYGFLLLFLAILAAYVGYIGLIKRETTKAFSAVINFIVIFVTSAFFIAWSPEVIEQINDFSRDISTGVMDIGSHITFGDGAPSTGSGDGTSLMRENLFAMQVYQPWILLQFGTTDISEIGQGRINDLLAADPDLKEREEAVKSDIETYENGYMTTTKVLQRLGMVFFVFIFNIGITVFVFLLTGYMLLAQVMFIVYAMFLPMSCIISVLPTQGTLVKKAVFRLFNSILFRAGITLIVVVALSISSMFYSLSSNYSFFMVALLQIVTFLGIYTQMNNILGMMSLQDGGSMQGIGRRMFSYPRMMMRRQFGRMNRSLRRSHGWGGYGSRWKSSRTADYGRRSRPTRAASHTWENAGGTRASRAGRFVGNVADMPGRVRSRMDSAKDAVRNAPVNAGHRIRKGVTDFSDAVTGTMQENRENRRQGKLRRSQEVAARRRSLYNYRNRGRSRILSGGLMSVAEMSDTPVVWRAWTRDGAHGLKDKLLKRNIHGHQNSNRNRQRNGNYENPNSSTRRDTSGRIRSARYQSPSVRRASVDRSASGSRKYENPEVLTYKERRQKIYEERMADAASGSSDQVRKPSRHARNDGYVRSTSTSKSRYQNSEIQTRQEQREQRREDRKKAKADRRSIRKKR